MLHHPSNNILINKQFFYFHYKAPSCIFIITLDANETVEESGVNPFKAKNVRFQQTPKNLNQVTSALTPDANAKVVNVVQDVKKVTADAKAAGQPQVPEPFAGQVVYAESINCFFVHRLSNSDLYDEACILVFNSCIILFILFEADQQSLTYNF